MPGVRIRPLDMRRYREEIRTIVRIFNDAWADNWGFIPFGEAEAAYLAASRSGRWSTPAASRSASSTASRWR